MQHWLCIHWPLTMDFLLSTIHLFVNIFTILESFRSFQMDFSCYSNSLYSWPIHWEELLYLIHSKFTIKCMELGSRHLWMVSGESFMCKDILNDCTNIYHGFSIKVLMDFTIFQSWCHSDLRQQDVIQSLNSWKLAREVTGQYMKLYVIKLQLDFYAHMEFIN